MKISIYLLLILSCATYVLAAVEVLLAQSCRDYKYLFDKAIPSALSRAKLVFDAMLSLEVNDPVDKMAQLLFGSGKGGGSFDQAHGRYKSISDLVYNPGHLVYNPGHPLVSENQRVRGMTIVIFCGFSRFVLEQGIYVDRPNNIKITESEWKEFALDWGLVAIAEHIEYAQSLNGRSAKASAITFRLEYLARMQSRFMSGAAYCLFDDPNSEHTINNCAARIDDFWQLAGQGPDKAFGSSLPMDAVNRALDSLLIHELSHAYYCGKTIDAEQKGLYSAYGWKNACIMKNQGNADSIALFAAAVKLIKIGYVVNPDGSFYKA